MIDFIAEIVGGLADLAIDLLVEPWIGRLREKRKQKKKSVENIGRQTGYTVENRK